MLENALPFRCVASDLLTGALAELSDTPLASEEELSSSIGVASQMLQALTERNVLRSLKEPAPGDVLISPDLDGISFMNFGLSERAMAAGEHAARRLAGRLQALAVSPETCAAIEAARVAAMAGADSARRSRGSTFGARRTPAAPRSRHGSGCKKATE